MSILEMNWQAAILIVIIMLLRILAINCLPKKTFLVLWAVVLCRLLIPFSFATSISIYNLLPGSVAYRPSLIKGSAAIADGRTAFTLLAVIWIAVAGAAGIYLIICYTRCHRIFHTSLPAENQYITQWLKDTVLRRTIAVRISDRITAPLTYGIRRPVILLPKTLNWKDTQCLEYVLAHELTHIRRFDSVIKILLMGVICLHWFNPLVWMLYALANQDLEICCDETVVRRYGLASAPAYALALLTLQEKNNNYTVYSAFSRHPLEERIKTIMKLKKPSKIGMIAAIMLTASLTIGFTTNAKTIPTSPKLSAATAGISKEQEDQPVLQPAADQDKKINVTVDHESTQDSFQGTLVQNSDKTLLVKDLEPSEIENDRETARVIEENLTDLEEGSGHTTKEIDSAPILMEIP